MKMKFTPSQKIFNIFNYSFLIFSTIVCIIPILHLLAVSFSQGWAVEAGKVGILPVGFTLEPYKFVINTPEFIRAFWVSSKRVILGSVVNMIFTLITAYPLSKSVFTFRSRKFYIWYFIITMLFSGGLIPVYMIVSKVGLINSIWSLILPGAVPIFNVIILMNFFKEIPDEIEEAAFIDGASYWETLLKIYVPLSKPALATLTLFCIVVHWNSWFDGILYMNRPENYPLQSYLQTVVIQVDLKFSIGIGEQLERLAQINQRNMRAAKIFVAMIPVLAAYPFLQKYFTKGIVLGSVKG